MTAEPFARAARVGRWTSIAAELLLVGIGATFLLADSPDLVLALWCLLGTAYSVITIVALTVSSWRPALATAPDMSGGAGRVEYLVSVLSTLFASLVGALSAVELVLLRSSSEAAHTVTGVQVAAQFSILGVWAMVLSWGLLHWGFAQVYRYLFYSRSERPLRFPRTDNPKLVDFAYFSFTLGTSFAVSDVEALGSRMRWVLVWHSVPSFFFNGLIIVLALNTIMTAGQ